MANIQIFKLPYAGEAREILRSKGQFWTPEWIADAMVEYVLTHNEQTIFDPAVGAGAFLRATKRIAREKGVNVHFEGMDIDPDAINQALRYDTATAEIQHITIGDFIFEKPTQQYSAIVANPPYIRHHRLTPEKKEYLKQLSIRTLGKKLDGRAGLHIYFLIQSLTMLEQNGRLAFIMPADTCEGKFAPDLWQWISTHYCLDAVMTFASEASPFPNVDTNPLVFLIRNAPPQSSFVWAKCHTVSPESLTLWIRSGFRHDRESQLESTTRNLNEALKTGLSRPATNGSTSTYTLGDFAKVVRGVATGANEFFFLTRKQIELSGIPESYFIRAIGRTRDIQEAEITQTTLDTLENKGRPTFLLNLNGEPYEQFPLSLQQYLKYGEQLGLPLKPLISQRKPWYKTEKRTVPAFLFAYLGRRNVRFIRNTAGIIPLTGFLCVYPKFDNHQFYNNFWRVLNHPDTIANLVLIGKSYGDGAIKVEPRSLEKLPIPLHVIDQHLQNQATYTQKTSLPEQLRLLENTLSYDVHEIDV